MNVEIETETPLFLFWEYFFLNFGTLSLQCRRPSLIVPFQELYKNKESSTKVFIVFFYNNGSVIREARHGAVAMLFVYCIRKLRV
jgi:hypothetical protein